MDIQLLHHMIFMGFNRLFTDAEEGSDFRDRMALGDQLQDLPLPVGNKIIVSPPSPKLTLILQYI